MSSFLAELSADLLDYEAMKELRSGTGLTSVRAGIASEDLRVLALLREEASRLAALTAGAASIANAQVRNPARRTATLSLAPRFSAHVAEQLTRLAFTEAFFEIYQLWFAADSRLAFARELSEAAEREVTDFERPRTLQPDAVADAWCRACSSIIALLRGLAQLMSGHGVSVAPPHESDVLAVLEQAANGLTPCIDRDGNFSLPGWAERRKEQRRVVTMPVQIGLGIKSYPATLRNISSSGMEIETGFMVPNGTRLIVRWRGDRQHAGKVCWCDGQKVGITLDTPLDQGDPLWTLAAIGDDESSATDGPLLQSARAGST